MLKNKKLVIFDMDGTTIDTLCDLNNAVNYALEKNGYPKRSLEHSRISVGNGVAMLIKRSVPENTSEEAYKKTLKDFEEYYSKHASDSTKPYKGVFEVLTMLKQRGFMLAIATNKLEGVAIELANKFYPNIFDTICGDNGIRAKKPASDQVEEISKRLSFYDKSKIIYIGDSEVDYQFAVNSGVEPLLVTYGYRTLKELKERIPEKFNFISDIHELI